MPRKPFRLNPGELTHGEFLGSLNSLDHLSVVLRAHAYIEAALLDVIETHLHETSHMDWSRWSFDQKIDLAIALDLMDRSEVPAFRKVNGIRNTLAHNPAARATVGDVQDLIDSLNSVQRSILVKALDRELVAGHDLAPILAMLFNTIITRLEPARTSAPQRTTRLMNYKAMLEAATKELERERAKRQT